MAVGSTTDVRGMGRTLALRTSGGGWKIQPTPAIRGASRTSLSGVSCTSTSDCTAVGSYLTVPDTTLGLGPSSPLAEHWDGRSWRRVPVPMAPGAVTESLGAVSCQSPDLCIAVGSYTESSGAGRPLALLWNGTGWITQTLPLPSGGSGPGLSGVSCSSASACTAVGSYTDQAGNAVTLVESWHGSTWRVEHSPSPGGSGTSSSLNAISCPSATTCTAVGVKSTSSNQTSFAERRQAGRWTIERTPTPRGGSFLYLTAVSCSSVDQCAAVGLYSDAAGNALAVAELSSGGGWTAEKVRGSFLAGVSCPSATSCTAAGLTYQANGGTTTLADTWDGTAWTATVTPDPPGAVQTELNAVSCTGASSCTAVGDSQGVTLAEAWHGGQQWSLEPGPALNGSLNGVACMTARSCIAVGSNSGAALAEQWNGTRWTTMTVPDPGGATNVSLSSVACPAASSCTAVGTYSDSTGGAQALAETWDGTTWSIQSIPTPPTGGFLSLASVSCSAPGACVAVGGYYDSGVGDQTLAESWNGTAWTIDTTVNPTNFSRLGSVSCVSATACTAVGFATAGALAEAWNGSTWTVQPTPLPANAEGGGDVLSAVSCTAAAACTTIGYYYNNYNLGTNFDMADRWNGRKWTLESVPTPNDVFFPGTFPQGLSCTTASRCAAVGKYLTTGFVYVTLALTEG